MSAPQSSLASTGKFKEFTLLFFPILLMGFSSCLFLLVEKVLLARLSIQEMEAAVSVAYICQVFQLSCIALAMMAQVSVARHTGAKQWQSIGPGIWQFIWFAFISILITVPIGVVYGNYYLANTPIREIALPYFYLLLNFNFLYPLGTALSCFYLGRGKTRLILFATIGSQILKIVLAVPLILGWGTWFPSLGLIGGSLSTVIAQGGLCLFLFCTFISSRNREMYKSGSWAFQPKLFWESIQPGLLRAGNRILNVTSWASTAQLMAVKGGDYLAVLSIGGALSLFLPFLGDAICQTLTVIVSQILGARRYDQLKTIFFCGLSYSLFCALLTSIPLVLFPHLTFSYLFPNLAIAPLFIEKVCLGIWLSFVFYTFAYIGISYVLAFKDMAFSFAMGCFSWINGYLFMYITLEKVGISPGQFWLVHSFLHGSAMLIYFFRAKQLCSRAIARTSVRIEKT